MGCVKYIPKKHLTQGNSRPYKETAKNNTSVIDNTLISNHKIATKTLMETVNCIRKLQRAGEGASPVRVNTAEDHSGVSVPKAADIHKSETYRLEKISSR